MENLYKQFLDFFSLKAQILNIPGIKYIKKGNKKEINKLTTESLIRCICVFTYIPQKHDI